MGYHGFSIYQGVNFWNSDGCFLQKWKTAIKNNKNVILYDKHYVRHFIMPNEIAIEILDLVSHNNNKINYPKKCYEIKLINVFNILKEMFPQNQFTIQNTHNIFEKMVEEINPNTAILCLEKKELKSKLEKIIYH